jgi:very-short-patch-repair endonuclease/predicted transcriptional regulator of viral defense system
MDPSESQRRNAELWALAKRQHGVVAHRQLLTLGFSTHAIKHRMARGRLHPIRRGVYAVGRPELTRLGEWMAAVLSCGPEAVLSHESAAALWRIRSDRTGTVDISVPANVDRRHRDIRIHRRANLSTFETALHRGIPVTSPVSTLVDLAVGLPPDQLEAAVNAADKNGLIDPETLRVALQALPRRPGLAVLRRTLDRHTFRITDSELERRFLRLVRGAGLPLPLTQQRVNGYRVDFYWPELGLVVETDGLRYHRTPAQQVVDHRRDQAHAAAGLEQLRFPRAQIRYESQRVLVTLTRVIGRLSAERRR